MSNTSKAHRESAARELRQGRSGGSAQSKADNAKRAAAYKALAESEEWLGGEKLRSRKRPKR